jgi:hypothetical protein
VIFAPSLGAAPQLALRMVVLSGDSPAGIPASDAFHAFAGVPVIDNHGNFAFIASFGLGGDAYGIWLESSYGRRMIARSSDPAPNTGAVFAQFSDLVLADGGITAFKAQLAGSVIGDDNRDSIWLNRSGTLTLVAQAGHEAHSTGADLRFSHFETPIAASVDGQVSFFARTRDKESGTAQGSGIWTTGSNRISLAANDGASAIVGLPDVVFLPQSFEQPFSNNPIISPAGQIIFRGFLAGPGVDETNLNGLWSYRPGVGLESLLRAGDEAVGMGGVPFLSFPSIPTINAAGDTAFLAFFDSDHHQAEGLFDVAPGTTEPHEHEHQLGLGLWLRRASGELNNIFVIGDPAPGVAGDVHFVDTFDPIMNASGRVAFLAAVHGEGVDGSNEMGLWSSGRSPDGALRLVARQGDEAPGVGNGFVFGTFLEPTLNAAGQVAFMAAGYQQVNGAIVHSAFGIWGQDRAGHLRLVARVGELLEVAPGDEREIASLAFASKTGGEDGKPRGLNDFGQIVLHATFTDGSSGVFVSSALAVPEPNSFAIVLFAGACLGLVTRASDIGSGRAHRQQHCATNMQLPR